MMKSGRPGIIGIDPGFASGAVAVLSPEGDTAFDQPILKGQGIDVHVLADAPGRCGASHAFIERVAAMPGQGVTSTFHFGYGVGQIHAAVALACIPLTLVAPTTWKKAQGLGQAKGETAAAFKERSRARALQLFPGLAQQLARKKDADRAEALLIARYGRSLL